MKGRKIKNTTNGDGEMNYRKDISLTWWSIGLTIIKPCLQSPALYKLDVVIQICNASTFKFKTRSSEIPNYLATQKFGSQVRLHKKLPPPYPTPPIKRKRKKVKQKEEIQL